MRFHIGSELTKHEDEKADVILKKLYDKLKDVFGITLAGNRLTLRFGEGDDLLQAHMIILDVDDGKWDECEWCGCSDNVRMTEVKTEVEGFKTKSKISLCVDCRCPK